MPVLFIAMFLAFVVLINIVFITLVMGIEILKQQINKIRIKRAIKGIIIQDKMEEEEQFIETVEEPIKKLKNKFNRYTALSRRDK